MELTARTHTQPAAPGILVVGVSLFVVLHLVASTALPGPLWSVHHIRFLSVPGMILWCATLLALAPQFQGVIAGLHRRLLLSLKGRRGLLTIAALVGGLAMFLALRSRNLFSGDGYLIVSIVSEADDSRAHRAGHVAIVISKALLAGLRLLFPSVGADWALALLSAFAGVLVLVLSPRVANALLPQRRSSALLAATLVTAGGVALFFGHVEVYPPMQAALLFHLYLAIRYMRGAGGLIGPTIALVIASALHPTALALTPAWLTVIHGQRHYGHRALLLIIIPILAAACGLWIFLPQLKSTYGGLAALVPLIDPERTHAYTLFSLEHLAFMGNVLLLDVGGGWLLLLLLLPGATSRERPVATGVGGSTEDRKVRLFLVAASVSTLLTVFVIDLRLGCRDWDLAALPMFPLLLLIGHLALSRGTEPTARAVVLLIGAMLLHTEPIVLINADRDASVKALLAATASDPQYSRPGSTGNGILGVLFGEAGYLPEAGVVFERAVAHAEDTTDILNLGLNYVERGRREEAIALFRRAIQTDPLNEKAFLNLGVALEETGRFDEAERVLRTVTGFAPGNPLAHLFLGMLLVQRGRAEEAISALRRSVEIDPEQVAGWDYLGRAYSAVGREADVTCPPQTGPGTKLESRRPWPGKEGEDGIEETAPARGGTREAA